MKILRCNVNGMHRGLKEIKKMKKSVECAEASQDIT